MAKRQYAKNRCGRNASAEERFSRWSEYTENGCRVWTGTLFRDGYGQMTWKGRVRRAHAVAWEEAGRGSLPAGMVFCHTCDNRRCVNPDHMFIGTNKDNMADMVAKGRSGRGSKNANAKLTAEQVRAIRQDGRPHKQIAADYGIKSSNVSHIKTRRNWASIPD